MVEKIEINLIPAEYIVRKRNFSIDLSIAVPVAVALVFIAAALIWLFVLKSQIVREKETIANLERKIEQNKVIKDEIDLLEKKQAAMQVKVNALKSINVNREKWVDALELYASIIPENAWLTGIEETDNGMITLNGITEADAEVGQFMNRLFNSPSVSGVTLLEMRDAGKNGLQKSFTIQHSLINLSGN
ncbi:MAG: PilN domain-containing protein [Chitinivibrionia bacterium]|nr:PilN domain-containing protein [Chitinivibrionia bacterium]